jgi:glycosyltransferase involved in cell wall biosynthesis
VTTALSATEIVPADEATTRGTVLHLGAPVTLRTVVGSHFAALRAAGWRNVVCAAPDPHTTALRADPNVEVVHGYIGHRPRSVDLVRGTFAFAGLLARRRFDIVHTHNAHHGVVGRTLAGLVPGTGVVHTWRYSPLDAARSDTERHAYLLVERLAGRLGDFVLFQNREDEAEALSLGLVRPRQAVFIGNGIPLGALRARVDRSRADARRQLGLAPEVVLIGVVGRLQERKGQRFVLEALPRIRASVPDAQLLIVGDGPDRAELVRLADRLGVHGSVQFAGFLDNAVELLPALDVFVLASRREGLSKALMEAMLAGLPVVATNVVGNRELIRDGENGLLVSHADPPAISEAIVRILLDPGLARSLGERGREVVARDHDEARVVARIAAVYEEVARMHAPRRQRLGGAW